jgi:hypothetical protein
VIAVLDGELEKARLLMIGDPEYIIDRIGWGNSMASAPRRRWYSFIPSTSGHQVRDLRRF